MSEWKESLSLEETNKIRVSLGLKPIPDPSKEPAADAAPPEKTKDQIAEENFQQRKEDERREREKEALKSKLDKARNQRERARKLVGKGLGEDEDDGVKKEEGDTSGADTKAWVKRQKKRAKELAAKKAKELEEMDKQYEEQDAYGEEDLAGLKVAHGEDDFEEGEETVLTLKDSRILDDEDDELHNLNISENQKHAENLALKKKGRQAGQYTGYDDDEFVDGGVKAGVLKKYDDELAGKDGGGFTLGGAPITVKSKAAKGEAADDTPVERERVKLTMDYTKSFESDYLQEGDVGFKKPKKKKKRPMRTALVGEEDEDEDKKMVPIEAIQRENLDDTNLIDDDDLQAQLARSRREANRKKIAELKAAAAAAPATMDVDGKVKVESDDEDTKPDGDDVLVLDDTSEFVRNISIAASAPARPSTNGVLVKSEGTATVVPSVPAKAATPPPRSGIESVQVKAEETDVPIGEIGGGWGSPREDGEESDDGGMMEVYEDEKPKNEGDGEGIDDDGITGGEVLVSKGLVSTMNLLRQQGLLKHQTPEEAARDKANREREAWVAKQRNRDRERELEKLRSKEMGDLKTQQQREYENKMRDRREAEENLRAYDNYKPNVNLTYHDEFGRDMTPKEAWKQLSHSFHGKTSGSKKMDKRLKKIEDEQKRLAMASGDTPLSTAQAFAARAERMGSATMVLSVGNKGAAPQQEQLLGGPDKHLKKGDKGKGKDKSDKTHGLSSGTGTVFSDIPMRSLPLPSDVDSPSTSRLGSPAIRSGFAPVGGFSPLNASSSASGTDTPGEAEKKERFVIQAGGKRKAGGEPEGSPASKRR
ncbi:SART-1 protein [Meredithblackwellia eburnea MCA 4105]